MSHTVESPSAGSELAMIVAINATWNEIVGFVIAHVSPNGRMTTSRVDRLPRGDVTRPLTVEIIAGSHRIGIETLVGGASHSASIELSLESLTKGDVLVVPVYATSISTVIPRSHSVSSTRIRPGSLEILNPSHPPPENDLPGSSSY